VQILSSTFAHPACRAGTRIELDPGIGVDAIDILLKNDLLSRFPDLGSQFKERKVAIDSELKRLRVSESAQLEKELSAVRPEETIFFGLFQRMKALFP
jgi:hypothetical protein